MKSLLKYHQIVATVAKKNLLLRDLLSFCFYEKLLAKDGVSFYLTFENLRKPFDELVLKVLF